MRNNKYVFYSFLILAVNTCLLNNSITVGVTSVSNGSNSGIVSPLVNFTNRHPQGRERVLRCLAGGALLGLLPPELLTQIRQLGPPVIVAESHVSGLVWSQEYFSACVPDKYYENH
jgi:hypothetical protein